MATVFLACRRGPLGFERTVAIKRANVRASHDPEQLAQLTQEAQLASRVHHPNVISVIDVELVDGEPMLIMEYIEGTSLAQLMAAGSLSPEVVARILTDVCEGLSAVHAARDDEGRGLGLVHRDISPQNVLVGIDGIARIADFGIAVARTSARTTSHGSRRGKPGYMSPEYVDDGEARATCDVYALGVVMWEALTGRRLFARARTLQELRTYHQREVPPPSYFAEGMRTEWDEICLRALGKGELPRFETADELGKALEEASVGTMASRQEVGRIVEAIAHDSIWLRRAIVRERQRASQPDLEHSASLLRVRTGEAHVQGCNAPRSPSIVHELPTRREVSDVPLDVWVPEPSPPTVQPPSLSSVSPFSRRLRQLGATHRGSAVAGAIVGLVLSVIVTTQLTRAGGDPEGKAQTVRATSWSAER